MRLIPCKKSNYLVDPFLGWDDFHKQVDQLFNFSMSPWTTGGLLEGSAPAIDIYDAGDDLVVKVDLPGLSKDEIKISVQDNQLVLKGEKKKENEVKEENSLRTERFFGSFYRSVRLPSQVDAGKAKAKYVDGVLTLTIPKKEEAKPKDIKIDVK